MAELSPNHDAVETQKIVNEEKKVPSLHNGPEHVTKQHNEKIESPPLNSDPDRTTEHHSALVNGNDLGNNNKHKSSIENQNTKTDISNTSEDQPKSVREEMNGSKSLNLDTPGNESIETSMNELEQHNETLRKKMSEMSNNLTAIIGKTSPDKVNSHHESLEKAGEENDDKDPHGDASDIDDLSKQTTESAQKDPLSNERVDNESKSIQDSILDTKNQNSVDMVNIDPLHDNGNIGKEESTLKSGNSIEQIVDKDTPDTEPVSKLDKNQLKSVKSSDKSSEHDTTESAREIAEDATGDEVDGQTVEKHSVVLSNKTTESSEIPQVIPETQESVEKSESDQNALNLNNGGESDGLKAESDDLNESFGDTDVPLVIDTSFDQSELASVRESSEQENENLLHDSEKSADQAKSNTTNEPSAPTPTSESPEKVPSINELDNKHGQPKLPVIDDTSTSSITNGTPETSTVNNPSDSAPTHESLNGETINEKSEKDKQQESSEMSTTDKQSEITDTNVTKESVPENKTIESITTNNPGEEAGIDKQGESVITSEQTENLESGSDECMKTKNNDIDNKSKESEQKTVQAPAPSEVSEQKVAQDSVSTTVTTEAPSTNKGNPIKLIAASSREASPDVSSPFDWSQLGVQRCMNCKFTTDDEEIFKNHATTCSKAKQGEVKLSCGLGVPMSYSCDSCNISWVNKTEFEEHVVCHIVDSPYLCMTCKRNFQSRHAIERHAKVDHPQGDSKCALRGMKKCRHYVREVEVAGKVSFQGRITIPRTPRNQIEIPGTSSTDITGNAQTPSAISMPNSRPLINKFMHVATAGEVQNTQPTVQDSVSLSTLTTLKNKVDPKMTPEEQQSLTSLFQVLDKDSPNGNFHPAQLPSKIQKMVNATTSNSAQLTSQTPGSNTSPYHVKNFTEFSQPQTTQPTVKTLSSTPLFLIPVNMTGIPVPQMNQPIVHTLQTPQVVPPGRNVSNPTVNYQPQVAQPQHTVTKPGVSLLNNQNLIQNLQKPPQQLSLQIGPNVTQPQMPVANQPQPGQFLLLSTPGSFTTISSPTVSTVKLQTVPSLSTSTAGVSTTSAAEASRVTTATGQHKPAVSTAAMNLGELPRVPSVQKGAAAAMPTFTPQKVEPVLLIRNVNAGNSTTAIAAKVDGPNVSVPALPTQPAPATNQASVDKDKTYTFRIKPHKGFVCESCRKYTRDELVFRKHIWEHFHVHSLTCKYCKDRDSADFAKKGITGCKLVAEIVCKLVKRSSEVKEDLILVKPNNEAKFDPILIDITSDDDDVVITEGKSRRNKGKESQAVEVIVLDDDSDNESDNLNIKITSTYSLGPDDLENMNKETMDTTSSHTITSHTTGVHIEPVDSSSTYKTESNKPQPGGVERQSNQGEVTSVNKIEETKAKEIVNTVAAPEPMDTDEPNKSETVSRPMTEQELNTQKLLSKTFDEISQPYVNTETNAAKDQISCKQDPKPVVCSRVASQDLNSMSALITKKVQFEANIVSTQGHNAYYMCPYVQCSFSCLTSQTYREHLQANHMNEYNYVCCHCGRKEYNEDTHIRHVVSHSNTKQFYLYKCSARLCKYKTNLVHMYAEHVKKHPDFVIDCNYCHKKFNTVESLISHLNENLLKYVSCPHCPFKFAKKNVVLEHLKLFHREKPRILTVTCQIVCKDRDLYFYYVPKIKKLQVNPSLTETSAEAMNIHALLDELEKGTVNEGNSGSDSITNVASNGNENTQQTLQKEAGSSQTGQSKTDKKEHKNSGKQKIKVGNGPKSFKCPHCSYLSYNQTFHIQHISTHDNGPERDKRFVCNLCPKGLDNLSQFKKHVGNHIGRNEIKTFHCTLCPFSTNQKCHIQDHLADNHNKEGLYVQSLDEVVSNEAKCKYCDFRAKKAETVVQHEKAVHRVGTTENVDNTELGPPVLEKEKGGIQKTWISNKKNKYHCSYCTNLFKHKNDLKEHMEEDHHDITNKQFVFYKCKYCSYTSTMKDFIAKHTRNKHPDKNLTMLRKIETIVSLPESAPELTEEPGVPEAQVQPEESIVKERIGIPDGNTFKHPFKCTKCDFSSNLRIKVMRHIKEHPELTPVREVRMTPKKKVTARKSTGPMTPELPARKAHGALFQDVPRAKMTNPFASLRSEEDSSSQDSSDVQRSATDEGNSLYILGEKDLHVKLSSCFIPLEKDMKFQCRICSQKIAKKFVLHRHILNHLNIVFFKCKYCEEGSIEQSLLYGHIQREHTQMPLEFTQMTKAELDVEFKEKIFGQNFNDIASGMNEVERSVSPAESGGIITQAVHERLEDVSIVDLLSNQRIKSCPYCEYTNTRMNLMVNHIKYHFDPEKNYKCSECHYRSTKFLVVKHIYRIHLGRKKAQVIKDTSLPPTALPEKKKDLQAEAVESSTASGGEACKDTLHVSSSDVDEDSNDAVDDDKVNKELATANESPKPKMKSMYKCRECGIMRESVSAMYFHFKNFSKCNKPLYKCSLCYFKSGVKTEIIKHGRLRHEGKKAVVVNQPLKAKFLKVNIPVPDKKDKSSDRSSRESSISIDKKASCVCQICRHPSDSLMTLQYHINTAHGGRMLYCQECQYKTPLVKHVINHCANIHRQVQANYGLQKRGTSLTSEEDANSVASATSITSPDSKSFYQCTKCNYKTDFFQNVRRHFYSHFKYKPYKCTYCGASGREASAIKKHVSSVHPTKAFKFRFTKDKVLETKIEKLLLQVRRKKFRNDMTSGASRPNRLNKYKMVDKNVRTDGTLFYCDFCGHKSGRKHDIKVHAKNVHPAMKPSTGKRSLSPDGSDFSSPAKKVAKLDPNDRKNFEICTSEESEDDDDGDDDDESRPQMRYTVVLDADGSKLYKCPLCEYKGSKKSYLQKHMKVHGAKLFQCLYCDFSSKLLTNAYRHVENVHPGQELKCLNKKSKMIVSPRKMQFSPTTSSAFMSPPRMPDYQDDSSPLFRRKKSKKSVKYYCCNICPMKVRGKYHFRQHLALHPEYTKVISGDRASKLPCSYCSYVSSSLNDYSVHLSSHIGEVRFKCLYCDHTNFQRNQLVSHMANSHPDQPKLVVDREVKDVTALTMVDMSPKVCVKRLKMSKFKHYHKKFKRIRHLSEESSDES